MLRLLCYVDASVRTNCGRHPHVHSCKEDFEFDPRPGILKESPNTETRADRGCGRQSEAAAAVHDGRVIDSAAVGIPPSSP